MYFFETWKHSATLGLVWSCCMWIPFCTFIVTSIIYCQLLQNSVLLLPWKNFHMYWSHLLLLQLYFRHITVGSASWNVCVWDTVLDGHVSRGICQHHHGADLPASVLQVADHIILWGNYVGLYIYTGHCSWFSSIMFRVAFVKMIDTGTHFSQTTWSVPFKSSFRSFSIFIYHSP